MNLSREVTIGMKKYKKNRKRTIKKENHKEMFRYMIGVLHNPLTKK